jgi:hypothetical protein
MWFSSSRQARRNPSIRSGRNAFRPNLEALEDRCLPSLGAGALPPAFTSGGKLIAPRLDSLQHRLAPTAAPPAGNQQLEQAYGQLPINFELNAGQTDGQVRYLARGNGYALFLTSTGAVLNLQSASGVSADSTSVTGVALAMNLVGGNPNASVTGLDQLPGTSNYLIGNDPSQWRTNIANYGQVAYEDVYPSVNLVYYGNQQQLEYDFVAGPGADLRSIRFTMQGADSISLDNQGNLVLSTALGNVLEEAPVVYQEVGGARQPVAGQFVLLGHNEVGFQVGKHNANLPLTIDPVLSYSTYLGGSNNDQSEAIAVDSAGDAYITGFTLSTDFPTTAGAYQTSRGYARDVFVTKLNSTGTALIYSTYLGDSNTSRQSIGDQIPEGIAVDAAGNAYVTGQTTSTSFPTTTGAYQTKLGGSSDAFVTKLNATGTGLIYSTYLGGSGGDTGGGIALDSSGNAYIAGSTTSTNFPTTPGAYQTSPTTVFVAKLNATGTALVYSTYLGPGSSNFGYGIAVDSSGNAYVAGITSSSNFPTTAGAFQTIYGGGSSDLFVTKLNATGTALIYSTYLGGSGSDGNSVPGGGFIAVDGSGDAYVTGGTSSTNFPTTAGAFQTSLRGTQNAFVTELNVTGTALVYSTYLGGNGSDSARGIALDSFGDAYVTGSTSSTNFPTTAGAYQTTGTVFVTKLNALGTGLIYSTYFGGSNGDLGTGIAVDSSGNAYITGDTWSFDLPTTPGAFQTSYHGKNRASSNPDAFVAKFTF